MSIVTKNNRNLVIWIVCLPHVMISLTNFLFLLTFWDLANEEIIAINPR